MATSLRYQMGHTFLDNSGNPLASGTVHYYEAGTTTDEPIYSDAAGLTALPNPITLNSAGRAVDGSSNLVAIYLSDAGATDYKEVVKDSGGTTIWTDDNIPQPVDPTASLTDTAKPRIQWATDTDTSVSLTAGNLGGGRLADSSSNDITYAPISASTAGNGNGYLIKKTNGSNTITFDPDGSETVDGASTFSWTGDDLAYWFISDGANWQVASAYLTDIAGLIGIQSFTSDDTYTPTSGLVNAIVISTGAGGGGGGADSDGSGIAGAAGGGAGATCIEFFTAATIGASQTVTIGAAGTAGSGTNGTSGGAGGDTTFGALHTAGGGAAGTGTTAAGDALTFIAGVAGGAASGGTVNIPGGMSGPGLGHGGSGTINATSGHGGASFWGGGARAVLTGDSASVAGGAATAFGAGGSGAAVARSTTGAAGGAGAAGICVVFEFGF